MIASIALLAVAIVGITVGVIAISLDAARDDVGRSTYFVVESDESVDSIAERLKDEGLIRSPGYFRFRIRLQSKGDDIVAGRYRLDTAMSTSQMSRSLS